MRQRLSIASLAVVWVIASSVCAQRGGMRGRRGLDRGGQLAALEAMQQEIEALKADLDQESLPRGNWRDLSDAQRAELWERLMRRRAARTAALERIERQLLRLKGERAVRSGYEELIRKLKAIQKLAEAGEHQAVAECLAVLAAEQQEALDTQVGLIRRAFSPPGTSESPGDTARRTSFKPYVLWPDNSGVHINAHGGGVLYHLGRYYWFGEHKIAGPRGNSAQVGVHCYSSADLYNWTDEGIALKVSDDPASDIVTGCILERPKVIYNPRTERFVMWFHLELRGRGYEAARAGVAVSDHVTGPYRFLHSLRPNARTWPRNFTRAQQSADPPEAEPDGRSPAGTRAVRDGALTRRDYTGGQMARDMTLFVDHDGTAYHIFASEENFTMHIAQLSEDYLSHTGRWIRVFPMGHNEAPALFRHGNRYYLLTSGCTGWAPNAARGAVADSIWGPWRALGNPCSGVNPHVVMGPELTFGGQSTYVLPVAGRTDAFIAMFDGWRPRNPIDGRYVWLPVSFTDSGFQVAWKSEWDLSHFGTSRETPPDTEAAGYKRVWADEFNQDGPPDPDNWVFERGFVRNNELQWYRPDNARCENGLLIIEARRERFPNPDHDPRSRSWRRTRPFVEYTSSCLTTRGKHEWTYGRFEIKARIDTRPGLWPAIWTLGSSRSWPRCGEIDIMEYYTGEILANACWAAGRRWRGAWDTVRKPVAQLGGGDWPGRFHIWTMDWDPVSITIYVDGLLLNEIELEKTVNDRGRGANPFTEPHYILLNLALGGTRGGDPSDTEFPARFEVDYVRVYQK